VFLDRDIFEVTERASKAASTTKGKAYFDKGERRGMVPCRKMGREEILWRGFMKSAIQTTL
jgi:hypothetical protein